LNRVFERSSRRRRAVPGQIAGRIQRPNRHPVERGRETVRAPHRQRESVVGAGRFIHREEPLGVDAGVHPPHRRADVRLHKRSYGPRVQDSPGGIAGQVKDPGHEVRLVILRNRELDARSAVVLVVNEAQIVNAGHGKTERGERCVKTAPREVFGHKIDAVSADSQAKAVVASHGKCPQARSRHVDRPFSHKHETLLVLLGEGVVGEEDVVGEDA